MTGIVYTETIVHSAPADFVDQAPYQLLIVAMQDGSRITGRILGEAAAIDDVVVLTEIKEGIHFFSKASR